MFKNNKFGTRKFKPLKVLFFVMVFVAIAAALGWLVMFLWNWILPEAVGVKPLTFWKALGLLALSKILFGGFGKGGRSWKHNKKGHWRNKWMDMSVEERHEAKSRWKDYCKNKDTQNSDNQ
jgi:hypothetical protein